MQEKKQKKIPKKREKTKTRAVLRRASDNAQVLRVVVLYKKTAKTIFAGTDSCFFSILKRKVKKQEKKRKKWEENSKSQEIAMMKANIYIRRSS